MANELRDGQLLRRNGTSKSKGNQNFPAGATNAPMLWVSASLFSRVPCWREGQQLD